MDSNEQLPPRAPEPDAPEQTQGQNAPEMPRPIEEEVLAMPVSEESANTSDHLPQAATDQLAFSRQADLDRILSRLREDRSKHEQDAIDTAVRDVQQASSNEGQEWSLKRLDGLVNYINNGRMEEFKMDRQSLRDQQVEREKKRGAQIVDRMDRALTLAHDLARLRQHMYAEDPRRGEKLLDDKSALILIAMKIYDELKE